MTNLFGSLDIDIWDFVGIWCFEFDISEYLNTRYGVSKDDLSVGCRTVKFHTRFVPKVVSLTRYRHWVRSKTP